MKAKVIRESISDILKPKDHKSIIDSLIESGSLSEKFIVILTYFDGDYEKIYNEFFERGIDKEELIDSYIQFLSDLRRPSIEKAHWVLSDILKDHRDNISEDVIKKSLLYE